METLLTTLGLPFDQLVQAHITAENGIGTSEPSVLNTEGARVRTTPV